MEQALVRTLAASHCESLRCMSMSVLHVHCMLYCQMIGLKVIVWYRHNEMISKK